MISLEFLAFSFILSCDTNVVRHYVLTDDVYSCVLPVFALLKSRPQIKKSICWIVFLVTNKICATFLSHKYNISSTNIIKIPEYESTSPCTCIELDHAYLHGLYFWPQSYEINASYEGIIGVRVQSDSNRPLICLSNWQRIAPLSTEENGHRVYFWKYSKSNPDL